MKRSARSISVIDHLWTRLGYVFCIAILLCLSFQPATAAPFVKGDVFAALGGGRVDRFSSDGTFIESLTTDPSLYTTGMAFDSTGNLYVTLFSVNKVFVFDKNGVPKGTFGVGYSTPESIAFDRDGNIFVGNLSNGIRQYDPAGNFLRTIVNTRVDWLDITADNKTIYFTQEGRDIKTVDIATGMYGPNFTTSTAVRAYALRILPDGGVLLADHTDVKRYNKAGQVIQTYAAPNVNGWFALNLDPDGTSFWSGSFMTGKIYKFDIDTGRLLQVIDTKKGYYQLFGVVVHGELTAATRAGSNVRVIDTISAIGNELDAASFSKTPYSITPTADTTVIEWQFDAFSVGQKEDLGFDVILRNPQQGENRLVNHKLELIYTDAKGNTVHAELGPQYVHVLNSAFDSIISTDKPVYQANEDVLISANIKNLSEYARTIDAKVVIEDSQGVLVKEVTTLSNLNFAAGETKSFGNIIFNTGATLAGAYKARLLLYENQKQVGEASASFAIESAKALSSKVTTDKISYKANETVVITSQIQSTSPNYIFENLTARITITNIQGTGLYTDTKNIPILTPGQLTELKAYWNTTTNPKDTYTLKLEVLEGATILSTSTAAFEILSSSDTGEGLRGTITASPNPVYMGKDETITYTVTNSGNEDIANLNVKVLIVNPDTQEIKNTFESTINLPINTTAAGNLVSSTSNLAPRIYLAILQAKTAAMPEYKTLASTTFEVKPAIEITKTIPDVKNILVWLNYSWQSGQNTPDRSLIEKALNEAGVTYHIVLDKKDFETELRNPFYTDFMILGDHNPIEDHFSEELREQVYSGKGLLSSLFNRQNLDSDVFGIKFNGNLSGKDYPVELAESGIATAQTFQSYGRSLKVESLNPAETIGWIPEITNKGTTNHPGIVKREYGKGKVLFYAFDLGMSSAYYNQFAALLKNSITYIHNPLDTTAFHPNQLIPVEIEIKSLGGAFDIKITETYPAEIKLYDPSTEEWITDNPWTMNIRLEPNETKTILYYALTPDKTGIYALKTEMGYMENGTYNFYQTLSTDIVVNKDTVTAVADIITALRALSVSGQDKAKVDNAIRYITDVQGRAITTEQDIEKNVHDILKAIDFLLSVTSVDISNIRLIMDEFLMAWEGRWYENHSRMEKVASFLSTAA